MNKPLLSLVICCYERPTLLKECLDSFASQDVDVDETFEILVVDNSSDPSKSEAIKAVVASYVEYGYYRQSTGGLSAARNAGLRMAKGKYIGYIDDDAMAADGFISCVYDIINQDDYDCFGGPIISRWPFGRPRWLSSTYGNKPLLLSERGILVDAFNWGGNIFFRRAVLKDIGGFSENVGMHGRKMGYGAENLVQMAFRTKGMRIGYDPNLIVYHAILPYKLKLRWHFKAAFITARDGKSVFKEQYALRGFARTLKSLVASPIKGFSKIIKDKNYYLENLFLDTFQPWFVLAGKIRAIASK